MQLYKHKYKDLDIAMGVLRRFYRDDGYFYLTIRWFNIVNPANVFDMGVNDYIVITEDKFKDWEIYG